MVRSPLPNNRQHLNDARNRRSISTPAGEEIDEVVRRWWCQLDRKGTDAPPIAHVVPIAAGIQRHGWELFNPTLEMKESRERQSLDLQRHDEDDDDDVAFLLRLQQEQAQEEAAAALAAPGGRRGMQVREIVERLLHSNNNNNDDDDGDADGDGDATYEEDEDVREREEEGGGFGAEKGLQQLQQQPQQQDVFTAVSMLDCGRWWRPIRNWSLCATPTTCPCPWPSLSLRDLIGASSCCSPSRSRASGR